MSVFWKSADNWKKHNYFVYQLKFFIYELKFKTYVNSSENMKYKYGKHMLAISYTGIHVCCVILM